MSRYMYSIVQCSFDEDEMYLCTLPAAWTVKNGWNGGVPDKFTSYRGGDLCYWPVKAAGYRLLEKAKKVCGIGIDKKLLNAYRCKIKRIGFQTYNEACKEQKRMETCSDTDEIAPKKRLKTDANAADMFTEILNQKRNVDYTGVSRSVKKEAHQVEEDSFSNDGDESARKNILYESMSSPRTLPQSPQRLSPSNDQHVSPIIAEDAVTLGILLEKVQNLENQVNRCFLMLSQINAKLDAIGTRSSAEKVNDDDRINPNKNVFEPVKTLAELDNVEQLCGDEKFVESVIRYMGKMHGKHRFTGAGQTVCLQLIDYFVDRRFMREVSWTGVSKTKDRDGKLKKKIAFSKYNKFIDLFFLSVLNADELFSLEACHKFLKQCIRNSKQRLEDIKMVRMSVSRKRGRKMARPDDGAEDFAVNYEDLESNVSGEVSGEVQANNSTRHAENSIDSQEMVVEILEESILKSEPAVP